MDITKVKALYDFDGEPGSDELTIRTGQVLKVTRRDVGEGWWEGTNEEGVTGLFPAAYVEEISSSGQHGFQPQAPHSEPVAAMQDLLGVGDHNAVASASPDVGYNQPDNFYSQQATDAQDFWDDEWDDDSEGGGTTRTQPNSAAGGGAGHLHGQGSMADDASLGRGEGRTTVRRNLNRFSNFGKSGWDSYVLGSGKLPISEEKIYLQETEHGAVWNPISDPYSCIVSSPKKESKLKGLKSFIAYQITPSFNNIQVSRRYKHFDWLHERLEDKFSPIPIPPLPDKQISGRYEEMFIEHRRIQLQAFVDYVCKHPVLSHCWVWQHFITCTDEKMWKAGKRKAEKDEIVGANYFLALKAPEKPLDPVPTEHRADGFQRYIHEMDLAVKNLMATSVDQAKKHQRHYKSEFQRVGQSFLTMSNALRADDAAGVPTSKLSSALKVTGETYNDIGKLFEEQPKADWEPLSDVLHIYKGLLSSFPDILSFHKGAIQKRKECERLTSDHKMDPNQLNDVARRTDVVSYALLAEMDHFHGESAEDINKAMRSFLIEQIAFYEKVVNRLKETLTAFDV
ncbi:sorting nexin lst-4 [Ischnura elegans]|uniref:sorting nexin lst-4 n=1 Tax=Ischnura elegans TaxID=197161 RepID=UPI001ED87ECF|nr:sorting nexin lst-4 [Ischnura elegans]